MVENRMENGPENENKGGSEKEKERFCWRMPVKIIDRIYVGSVLSVLPPNSSELLYKLGIR
jgi:hypothetical protein